MKKILILLMALSFSFIGNAQTSISTEECVSNYKLYETSNMWTFLKLDTRTGQIWQVQYSVEGPEYRFETELSTVDLSYGANKKPGKYELYKTQNIHNFILLDKVEGKTWQVQWGKAGERQLIRIY